MMKNQWILITGASTGIGRVATEFLQQKGYSIYACARKEGDLQDLGRIPNVIPIKLDVTKNEQIEQAFQEISDRKTGLFGLINNAGIVHAGPTMDLDVEELKHQFDVNFFGVHRVTKQFFPLIKKSKGKIVMIGSGAGIIANPFFAPYSSSKFALEGYTDSLRRELLLYGIQVVIIEPGMVKTPIWDKGEALLGNYNGDMLKKEASGIGSMAVQTARDIGLPPEKIASLIYKILTKKNPKPRYAIVPNYWMRQLMLKMPTRMLDRFILKKMQKFQ
ncbi:hypothetical protein NEF87_004926 [Candidatus Lokiarchaeum ossiferum]|uniref:SDR family oxidoreductase n=1 Tax=Candidatus Lokiarchaeum ossiferum TaxID=2951803 RepID=A0ABY6HYN4_9ARCH|nr:hypothetical protein NEF87_004926 [Candidatus Lokiarchaeum sp. B-35]